jgi:hypothetical protein
VEDLAAVQQLVMYYGIFSVSACLFSSQWDTVKDEEKDAQVLVWIGGLAFGNGFVWI